jgi:hypothetical protein
MKGGKFLKNALETTFEKKAYFGQMKGGRFLKNVLQTTFEKGLLGPHEGRKVSQRYFLMFEKGLTWAMWKLQWRNMILKKNIPQSLMEVMERI